ncbi:response regulator [Cerasicoccus fimbriatus]|uniref:response regulator n=1 Tax=Cerasicoccus fimbriatus TaxID=3014554 RepID=UPI0022B3FF65|nr:response regulator [Cerasicoccus sp. TK19100]
MKPQVLVIDDCADARKLIHMILSPRGYVTWEAEDAVQAFELLKVERFDLVVIDIAMIGIDGFTIASEIRHGHVGPLNRDAFLVGCTALYLDKKNVSKDSTGMDLFFRKPLGVREFANKIDALMGRVAV